jgi:hypothetical protein
MQAPICNLFPPEQVRLNNYETEEKAIEAAARLNDPILQGALNEIYSGALGTLLEAEVGSLTASTAHATMKAVIAIIAQLEQYVADNKMRQKFGKGDK